MKPLLPRCLIGYKFGRMDVNKDYYVCCRSPAVGNYDKDGQSFKKFWYSDTYNNLRKELKYNFTMKMYFPDTMNRLIIDAGLKINNLWGNHELSCFDESSQVQIYECKL